MSLGTAPLGVSPHYLGRVCLPTHCCIHCPPFLLYNDLTTQSVNHFFCVGPQLGFLHWIGVVPSFTFHFMGDTPMPGVYHLEISWKHVWTFVLLTSWFTLFFCEHLRWLVIPVYYLGCLLEPPVTVRCSEIIFSPNLHVLVSKWCSRCLLLFGSGAGPRFS